MTELFHHYLRKTFPDTIFLPTFGNNDVEYHYNYPTLSSDINTLYSFTGDLFFNQNPDFSSTELLELDSTFMTGGYYVVKVDGIIFISLNTLMFDQAHNSKLNQTFPNDQLDWFDTVISLLPDTRNVIINMHIPAGVYWSSGKIQIFYNETYTARFQEILKRNHHKVIFTTGGHIHFMDLRYEETQSEHFDGSYPYFYMLTTPSISPYQFGNNPGFTVFDIQENQITHMNFKFVNLSLTYGDSPQFVFYEYNAFKDMGIDEFSPKGIMNFFLNLEENPQEFSNWNDMKFGYIPGSGKGNTLMAGLGQLTPSAHKKTNRYFCFSSHLLSADFNSCMRT